MSNLTIFYTHCGQSWQDEWSCACDSDCPECGKPIEAFYWVEPVALEGVKPVEVAGSVAEAWITVEGQRHALLVELPGEVTEQGALVTTQFMDAYIGALEAQGGTEGSYDRLW